MRWPLSLLALFLASYMTDTPSLLALKGALFTLPLTMILPPLMLARCNASAADPLAQQFHYVVSGASFVLFVSCFVAAADQYET